MHVNNKKKPVKKEGFKIQVTGNNLDKSRGVWKRGVVGDDI